MAYAVLLIAFLAPGIYFGKRFLGGSEQEPNPGPSPKDAQSQSSAAADSTWDNLFADPSSSGAELAENSVTEDTVAEDMSNGTVDVPESTTEEIDEAEALRPKRFASEGPSDELLSPLLNTIMDIAWSRDGRVVATFDGAGLATLWDVESRRGIDVSSPKLGSTTTHVDGTRHLSFAPDGAALVVGSSTKVAVIKLPEGSILWESGLEYESGPLLVDSLRQLVAIFEQDAESYENRLSVVEVTSGKTLFRSPPVDRTDYVALSPDRKLMAVEDGVHEKVRLFDLQAGKELTGIQGVVAARDMAFTPDSRMLVLPDVNGDRQLWDVSNPARAKLTMKTPIDYAVSGSPSILSPNGKLLVTGTALWDLPSNRPRGSLVGNYRYGTFSSDSTMIAGWSGAQVLVADAAGGATKTVVHCGTLDIGLERQVSCVALSPDGNRLAIGMLTGEVLLRTIGSTTASRELAILRFEVPENLRDDLSDMKKRFADDASFSADGKWLITTGPATTVWNLAERRQQMVLALNDGRGRWDNEPVRKTEPSGDDGGVLGGLLWQGGPSGFGTGSPFPLLTQGWLLHDDGSTLTVSGRGRLVHYNLRDGKHRIDGKEPMCPSMRGAPDGKIAAAWLLKPGKTREGDLVILETKDGKVRKSLGSFPSYANPKLLAFSPDSRLLAAVVGEGSQQFSIRIWNSQSGDELPTTAEMPATQLEFADEGKALAVINGSNVQLYDVETGASRNQIDLNRGHAGRVHGLVFAPRAPLVATSDEHGMVLLRDVTTGEERCRFQGHGAAVTALAFSSDGTQLATCGNDLTVKLWQVSELIR